MKVSGQYSVSAMSSSSISDRASVLATQASPVRSAALFLMGSLGDTNLSIRQPITLILENDDNGGFIASDPYFAVYGEGVAPAEALRDYRSSLEDYFFLLKDESATSPEDEQQFLKLKDFVDFDFPRLEFKGSSR
ncbi:MAG: hypothetical protein Q7S58_03400 [Candidatus Binatus sp.]|uniref:hypothetical protein n=1 Tax=Candidatus Binatus sp. TaxID=2811406 RepID=UPI00272068B3|nr:hypothetical protein [Candidatus Binatus sp.]MDO8431435.1 hypothetical protein [Candidatus Binatus sp.]